MATLLGRIESVRIPPVTEVCMRYVTGDVSSELAKDLEDRIFFSEFPEEDVSLSLSTLSMNTVNLDEMKKNGSLGVVIEMMRRIPPDFDPKSTHVADVIRCLCILTEEVSVQRKMLMNEYALPCIFALCRRTIGESQHQLVQVIDRLSRTKSGMNILVENNLFECFVSTELLCRAATTLSSRHSVALIITRAATIMPELFPIETFQALFYCGKTRKTDSFVEVQMLDAILSHLSWLNAEQKVMSVECTMMEYFIEEVKTESFEDVNHVSLRLAQNHRYVLISRFYVAASDSALHSIAFERYEANQIHVEPRAGLGASIRCENRL
jgi:hypothetical protein